MNGTSCALALVEKQAPGRREEPSHRRSAQETSPPKCRLGRLGGLENLRRALGTQGRQRRIGLIALQALGDIGSDRFHRFLAIPFFAEMPDGVARAAALGDGAVKEPLATAAKPAGSQTLAAPADSPKMVTQSGSPPKAAMLRLHPLQREDLVEQPIVARDALVRFARQQRVGQESQRPQTVVDASRPPRPAAPGSRR